MGPYARVCAKREIGGPGASGQRPLTVSEVAIYCFPSLLFWRALSRVAGGEIGQRRN